jgi:hypothetical protein
MKPGEWHPFCFDCKNFTGWKTAIYSCKAYPYPASIPPEILFGEVDHKKPFLGDNGIRFEAKAEA